MVKKTPLFMVKKEVFERIKTGKKTIELRKGKAKSGDQAVFQCSRKILRGKIVRTDEGSLLTLLHTMNFKEIIPTTNSVEEAKAHIKKLYGSTDGTFTAYQFALSR
jgi:ASC-1-like (ASCH) protein